MNILEVQDLCKTYGKGEAAVQALRHATFSVRKGEFIAIIGESGSGKSTLLKVVPTSSVLVTEIVPPCASTIDLASGKPNPIPCTSDEKRLR